jgi:HSP20 family protein
MSIVRWNPFNEIGAISDELNKLFYDGFTTGVKKADSNWVPAINLAETKDEYRITVDLPGISKENLDISVEGKVLTIKGERNEVKEEQENNFHKKEINYGSFQRQVTLAEHINQEQIKASYTNGVLEIKVLKEEKPVSKKITIE